VLRARGSGLAYPFHLEQEAELDGIDRLRQVEVEADLLGLGRRAQSGRQLRVAPARDSLKSGKDGDLERVCALEPSPRGALSGKKARAKRSRGH
jgi:hypothetical protein